MSGVTKEANEQMEKLRIVHWYTREIARHQIRVVAACPSMELVGAYVHHEEKNGVDAGEIAGIDPLGVRATNNMDEILALDADCVLYNPPTERYDEIIPIPRKWKECHRSAPRSSRSTSRPASPKPR